MKYLNSGFRQVNLESYFFPHEDVRISGPLKKAFQNIKLLTREGGPLAPLFLHC
jgi:hypothetical protein